MADTLYMTPNQRAFHLVVEFSYVNNWGIHSIQAKAYAITCVNEILKIKDLTFETRMHWEQVKKEIELL